MGGGTTDVLAVAVSAWLQGVVTRPILEVTGVAREVVEKRDFTLRARTQTRDEIGYLVQAFNDMLGEVGQRAQARRAHRARVSRRRHRQRDRHDEAADRVAPQNLTVDMPTTALSLDADPTRLAQVVGNLLNNAAKFSPLEGSIALRACIEGEWVEISVADNGAGIPADMIERVFDMFTQVDTSLDRATAGLGVGLTLARRLTELHGGTIRAESRGPDQGSTFTIRLPIASRDAPSVTRDDVAATAPARHQRILIADDNIDYAASLALILRSLGHEVVVTHDGAQALSAAREFRPSVAFLDIGLPRLHGYALARELRNHASTRDATLVAITGWGQDRDKQQAREAGFDHHFVKPVGVEHLLEVLAKA